MIRVLDDLVLLKEVDTITGANYNSTMLRRDYPEKIIIIRHHSYIYKSVLCDYVKERVTDLSDYIQLSELAESVPFNKETLLKRIYFMKKTGSLIFDYIEVCGLYFIKLEEEFKMLLQAYQPFLFNYNENYRNVVEFKLLGDLKVGFY